MTTIGVYDSSIGGLNFLAAIRQVVPSADFVFMADRGFPLHGFETLVALRERMVKTTRFLKARGADVIVLACNTATVSALSHLRECFPDTPLVGTVPVVAVAAANGARNIGVLATKRTAESEHYGDLVRQALRFPNVQVTTQACPGLAELIQDGDIYSVAGQELIRGFVEPLRRARVNTVVLGCTDYLYVQPIIEGLLPDTKFVDGAHIAAKQTAAIIAHMGPVGSSGRIELYSSAGPAHMQRVAETASRLLGDPSLRCAALPDLDQEMLQTDRIIGLL